MDFTRRLLSDVRDNQLNCITFKQTIMALWKITAKYSNNAPCKNKRQRLEKGMFVETSTASTTPPLGQTREHPMLAQLFLNKYGIEVNVHNMNSGYFNCEKIG